MTTKIKSYKVKDGLYVNEVPVKMLISSVPKAPQHQFIIIDRSGSMYYELDKLCDILIEYVGKLTEGSTVSVGWFGSSGSYGLSVPYTLKKELTGVTKTIDSYRSTKGCTCFDEVLHKVNENCSAENKGSLYFFTDGWHNSNPWMSVVKELEALRDKLEVSMFVGCGYINRDNMTDMADITDGSFIHIEDFSDFKQSLYDFGDGVTESVPGCIVEVPVEADNFCSVLGKQIIGYTFTEDTDKNHYIKYKASNKKTQVYYSTSATPIGEVKELGKNEVPFRALAYYLVQHNKTPMALDILNFLGDKYLINKLYNTFTNDEYAKVENTLRSSIFNSKSRYKEGKVPNFMPKDDAFCVLDALDVLTSDPKAIIHLTDPEFKYNHISRKSEQTDGAKLMYPKEITARASQLVYNETALNVSLQCWYEAGVKLDPKEFKETNAKEFDFNKYNMKSGEVYAVNCVRNYSIIADAKLNTPKLIVSKLSKSSVQKLAEILTARDDDKYVIDLANIPLINKTYLKETSAKKLAEACWESKMLGTNLSVLRYLTPADSIDYSSDKYKDLAKYFYIKNDIYQPPMTAVEATDEYMRYEFKVSFKGYSNASASSVIKKINEGKSITAREVPVKLAYDAYRNLDWKDINETYDKLNKEYKKLNNKIQHAKFAIILINRGSMPEFTSREDMSLEIDCRLGDAIEKVTTKFEVVQKPVKL
jgi:hypothetical protein